MKEPDLRDSFMYDGVRIDVDWYDVGAQDALPEIPWQQVYAVGNLDGRVPVVFYADGHHGLPGGRTEPGESVDQTIRREVHEEINCELIDWQPIGYQILHEAGKPDVNQLRLYGNLKKIGEFESDPGGGVIGYDLIGLDRLNATLAWGTAGQRIQTIAQSRAASSSD